MNRRKSAQSLIIFTAILALTILSCAGLSELPNPFATATPTPTNTFTPTPTFTATTSPTPTSTSTSTPLPTGKLKEELSDGRTLFTDYDGGYQITFPQDWTVVILEKDNLNQILDNLPEQEQNVSALIELAKNADVNKIIRVFGFNFKAQQGVYTPNINISYDTNALLEAVSLKDMISANSAYFPSLGIKVVNSEIKETSSGIEAGVIDVTWAVKISNGQEVTLQQRQVYFKSGKGMVVMTFSTLKDATIDLSSDIDQMIESIQLMDQ